MPLSDEDKRRIEEEESYREKVRHKAKAKRDNTGCLVILVLLGVLGVVIWMGAASGPKQTEDNARRADAGTQASPLCLPRLLS